MTISKNPYKGTRDFFPLEMRQREFVFNKMKQWAHLYSFELYDGPLLEEVELYLAKSGEELINDQIYSFTDRGGRHVTIRPEMTPTVARMVAQIHREVSKPLRWYSLSNFMRYEKPQKGRLREFWQFNADIFGAPENLGELEIFQLIIDFFTAFGATQKQFGIHLNDRRLIEAFLGKVLQLNSDEAKLIIKIIDKAKKIPPEVLKEQITQKLNTEQSKKIFDYLNISSFSEVQNFIKIHQMEDTCSSFIKFINLKNDFGLNDFIHFDPTIVRGLDYYTGIVFEVFDYHPDNKRALCGGGAYANLLEIFKEPPLHGVGFGLGDVTLIDFLEQHKLLPSFQSNKPLLFLSYQDQSSEKNIYQLARILRSFDIQVEVLPGTNKIKKAFIQAEKKQATVMGWIEDNNQTKELITLKNLKSQESSEFSFNSIEQIKKFLTH